MADTNGKKWWRRLMKHREDEVAHQHQPRVLAANSELEEHLAAARTMLRRVPQGQSPQHSEPSPPVAFSRKNRMPRCVASQPIGRNGPGTRGLMEKLFASLYAKNKVWEEEATIEDVRWLVEHADVTESKARLALEACSFVKADAYQLLVFGEG